MLNNCKDKGRKDINDDDEIRMTGLTESIAIEKHGNESKLFIV